MLKDIFILLLNKEFYITHTHAHARTKVALLGYVSQFWKFGDSKERFRGKKVYESEEAQTVWRCWQEDFLRKLKDCESLKVSHVLYIDTYFFFLKIEHISLFMNIGWWSVNNPFDNLWRRINIFCSFRRPPSQRGIKCALNCHFSFEVQEPLFSVMLENCLDTWWT